MMRSALALLVLALALIWGDAAQAQIQVTRSPGTTAPVLGNVVRGASATSFRIAPNGTVTRQSGDALRLSSGSVTTPTISLSCGLLGLNQLCALRRVRVTITASGQSADARISSFQVANISTGLLGVAVQPSEGQTVTFELYPFGVGTVTFTLGMTVLLSPGSTRGLETFNYTVTAEFV